MRTGIIILFILLWSGAVKSQAPDSAAMRAFFKVISFAGNPSLSYKAVTILSAHPVLEETDTATYSSEYIRDGNSVYLASGSEETLVRDGYVVRAISGEKKIIVRKWHGGGHEFSALPFDSAQLMKMLRNNYTVSLAPAGPHTSALMFEKMNTGDGYMTPQTSIRLLFDKQTWLPAEMTVTISLRQETDAAGIGLLRANGVSTDSVVKKIDGKWFVIREQEMAIQFTEISLAGDQKIPALKDWLVMNNGSFVPAGKYKGYEVITDF